MGPLCFCVSASCPFGAELPPTNFLVGRCPEEWDLHTRGGHVVSISGCSQIVPPSAWASWCSDQRHLRGCTEGHPASSTWQLVWEGRTGRLAPGPANIGPFPALESSPLMYPRPRHLLRLLVTSVDSHAASELIFLLNVVRLKNLIKIDNVFTRFNNQEAQRHVGQRFSFAAPSPSRCCSLGRWFQFLFLPSCRRLRESHGVLVLFVLNRVSWVSFSECKTSSLLLFPLNTCRAVHFIAAAAFTFIYVPLPTAFGCALFAV